MHLEQTFRVIVVPILSSTKAHLEKSCILCINHEVSFVIQKNSKKAQREAGSFMKVCCVNQ